MKRILAEVNGMTTYWKATQPDGYSFYGDPKVSYVRADGTPKAGIVRPAPTDEEPELCGPGVLHVADTPTETLIGGSWPCRLFEVTPLGDVIGREGHKLGFPGLTIVREVDATLALGPQGAHLEDLIATAESITGAQASDLAAARGAARDAARGAARDAARDAARGAAWYAAPLAARGAARGAAPLVARGAAPLAARDAAADAAGALVVRDLIGGRFTQKHYDLLTGPWRTAVGAIHPDDEPLIGGDR